MPLTKFLRCLIGTASLSVVYLSINSSPTWSQRIPADLSKPLLKGATCTVSRSDDNGAYNGFDTDSPVNISVNRQLYKASIRIHATANNFTMLTCKVDDPKQLNTLKLQMGVSDDDVNTNSLMSINIYQGGQKIHTYGNIKPGPGNSGNLINVTLDLQTRSVQKSPEDVAIELVCHRDWCKVYFFEAQLLPNSNSISRKSSESFMNSSLTIDSTRKSFQSAQMPLNTIYPQK